MPSLTIRDETLRGEVRNEFDIEVAFGSLTVRELIRRRVEEEVRHFNLKNAEVFRGLVQPEEAEVVLNGYRVKEGRRVDAEAQVRRALTAFESNGFFLLVDDRQVESLDDEIAIGMATKITFLRMVPLVGG